VGIHAIASVGQFRSMQSIAVFGCGPVGLLMLAAARALGAARVIAVDIVPSRLAFAKEYAATDVWKPLDRTEGESDMQYAKRNADAMKKELNIVEQGLGAIDLVVDASGAKSSIQVGMLIAGAGGTYVQVCIRPHL
jgi:D-xylulose reductase